MYWIDAKTCPPAEGVMVLALDADGEVHRAMRDTNWYDGWKAIHGSTNRCLSPLYWMPFVSPLPVKRKFSISVFLKGSKK
jgi:hypothetical protein